MQRLRISFARGGGAKYLSHLEMMKSWERVFRRAGWKVAHSHGFNPHPRIFFAAPLAVGVAAERDILEVHLDTRVHVAQATASLAESLPPSIEVVEVVEIDAEATPAQKSVRAAEYRAECPQSVSAEEVKASVARLLGAETVPRSRAKEGKSVTYDLRPLVYDLRVDGESAPAVTMKLRSDAQGAGRADEVLRELGLDPAECSITRTRLILEE